MHYVYILLCSDDTLYTGYAKDPEKRLAEHNAGKGAKYLRGRIPAKIVYLEKFNDKGAALKREARIKNLSRQNKKNLIELR